MSLSHRRGPRIGAGLLVIGVLLLVSGFSLAALADPGGVQLVEICHCEGHSGSDEYHTIEVAPSAVSSHLASGFDYLGPCVTPSDGSTSTTEDWTSTTADQTSTTMDWTSTTVDQTSTTMDWTSTTVAATPVTLDSTSTTLAVAPASEEATSTTVASTSTTTSEDAGVDATDDEQTTSTTATSTSTDTEAEEVEELPYTGANMLFVIPGVLFVAVGAFAVFVTGGLGHASAAHAAAGSQRFAMGLHRGRHEA